MTNSTMEDNLPPEPSKGSENTGAITPETAESTAVGMQVAEPSQADPAKIGDSENSDETEETEEEDEDSDDEFTNESLSSIIIREIQDGIYTCLVCTLEIDHSSKVWSCENCYRVYDLDCIQDWAKRGSSTTSDRKWRCPACNFETKKLPKKFTCWCGKVENPKSNSLIPFSCGNLCEHKYDDCIHSCSSPCHPGSHPVCGALGPLMKCKCGSFEKQLPCLITPYKTGWKCDVPCANEVCDMGHKCSKNECHSGFCGNCNESVKGKCYCGKAFVEIACQDKYIQWCQDRETNKWMGVSDCDQLTKVYFDCGLHFEELTCQPLPTETKVCEDSPAVRKTCYCGKTKITSSSRTKCTDPIPECENVCGKILPCGCECLLKCHEGDCECFNIFKVKCACENYSYLVPCKALQYGFKPKCTHKCSALLNCRKHYHKEVCCGYEKTALDRDRLRKKAVRNHTISSIDHDEVLMTIEPVHICTRSCNRLKACGKHHCDALCHSGPCGVCLESSNDDLICHCGKTVIEAPVRCGTQLVCQEQCVREKSCGHRPEIHHCHDGSVDCPKCTTLVTKICACGNKEFENVLCSNDPPACSKMCEAKKTCGHPCGKVCSADCLEQNIHASSSFCQYACSKLRERCPHRCKLKCHFNKVGKSKSCDANVCSEKVTVKCACGRMVNSVACGASLTEDSKIGFVLECDEKCEQVIRDQELKNAFLNETETDSTDTYVPTYDPSVISVYKKQTTWCSKTESFLRSFISNDDEPAKKVHHFPVMIKPQRDFIHNLATAYNLYSESQDAEPQRSVFVVITGQTKLPELTIRQAILELEEIELKKKREEEARMEELRKELFNAVLVQDVFLGITKGFMQEEVYTLADSVKLTDVSFEWISSSSLIIYSKAHYQEMTVEMENTLYLLQKALKKTCIEKSLAFDCKLALVNEELSEVLRTDTRINPKSVTDEKNSMEIEPSFNAFNVLNAVN